MADSSVFLNGLMKEYENISEKYEIRQRIGRGAFADVMLVKDLETSELKAVKVMQLVNLNIKNENSQKYIKKLQSEAAVISQLNHPNILKFYECFQFANNFCIVCEYCEEDLTKVLQNHVNNRTRPDRKLAIEWFYNLSRGLKYLHDIKIIHRDIKPSNILFKDKEIKIGDFGESKQILQTMTMMTICGTPQYMSPELLREEERFSYKTDVWSLGCVFYEIYYLEPAFVGESFNEVKRNVLNRNISNLHKHQNDMNVFIGLIDKMLCIDEQQRLSIRKVLSNELFTDYERNEVLDDEAMERSDIKDAKKKDSSSNKTTTNNNNNNNNNNSVLKNLRNSVEELNLKNKIKVKNMNTIPNDDDDDDDNRSVAGSIASLRPNYNNSSNKIKNKAESIDSDSDSSSQAYRRVTSPADYQKNIVPTPVRSKNNQSNMVDVKSYAPNDDEWVHNANILPVLDYNRNNHVKIKYREPDDSESDSGFVRSKVNYNDSSNEIKNKAKGSGSSNQAYPHVTSAAASGPTKNSESKVANVKSRPLNDELDKNTKNKPAKTNSNAMNTNMNTNTVYLKYLNDLKNKQTELIKASSLGQKEVVRSLIAKGVDVNTKDDFGNTALIEASKRGHMDVVKLLIENSANVNIKDDNGSTALKKAVDCGQDKIAKYLKSVGAKDDCVIS